MNSRMDARISWWLRLGTRLVLVAVILVLIVAAVLRVFDFSQAPDYGEGTLLATVERLARQPMSADWIEGPEYTLCPYGPIYYWTVRAATAVLPWQHSLLPGRLVSLLATLAVTALVMLLVRRHSQSVDLALLTGIILLVSPVVHTWATPHRVDPLAVLLALGGCMAIGLRRQGVVISACLIVLASLVKQNMALAGLPIFVWLLARRQFKAAAGYAVLVAGLGLIAWYSLDRATGGYFMATAVRSHLGAMWPQQGFLHFYWFVSTPLGLTAWLVTAWLLVKSPIEVCHSVYCLGFIASTLFAALLSSKEGASYAYFFEASVLGSLVIGLYGLPPVLALDRLRALTIGALLALVLVGPEARSLRHRGLRLDTVAYGSPTVSSRLPRSESGYVLADGQYLDAVLEAGLTPLVNDPFLFRQMVGTDNLEPTKVVEALQRGDVKYLVLKRTLSRHRQQLGKLSQKWPQEVLDAMEQHYVLDMATEEIYIYRHKSRGPG